MNFAEADRLPIQQTLPLERPAPDKLFRVGSQNHGLYCRLLEGPISNREIMRMCIPKYTGRLSETREVLKPYLMEIRAEYDPDDRSRVTYRLLEE